MMQVQEELDRDKGLLSGLSLLEHHSPEPPSSTQQLSVPCATCAIDQPIVAQGTKLDQQLH